MNDNEIKQGDIVFLKSKPDVKLTVSHVIDKTRISLTYYDETTKDFKKLIDYKNAYQKFKVID